MITSQRKYFSVDGSITIGSEAAVGWRIMILKVGRVNFKLHMNGGRRCKRAG